jgi:hypothetical protein
MNCITIALIVLLLSGFCGSPLMAQTEPEVTDSKDDSRGWSFGLNIGMYYPSKTTAAFYNGKSNNVNNAAYVMSNEYWYDEIYNALGAHDTVFVEGLPDNMRYNVAITPGLFAQYSFNSKLALMIEFNYMSLKSKDVITFEVDPISSVSTNPDLRLYPINGSEKRVYANIGLKRSIQKSDKLSYFITGGLTVNSTTVKKSSFYVVETEYSMVNNYDGGYVPGANNQTFSVYQGGIGFGMFAGGGASFVFGNGMVVEPGLTANWLVVKLEGYQNMTPGIGIYLRFML